MIAVTGLTDREKQALRHLFAGQQNSEIAANMGLSVGTVKGLLRMAYLKLEIHNVRQLFPLVIAGQRELLMQQAPNKALAARGIADA